MKSKELSQQRRKLRAFKVEGRVKAGEHPVAVSLGEGPHRDPATVAYDRALGAKS